MTVEDMSVVDIISTRPDGTVCLAISDHLDWTDWGEHLLTLQEKVNRYLAFIESGEILERYPSARNKPIVIKVYCRYPPLNKEAKIFLARIGPIVKGAGFEFEWEVPADDVVQ